MEFIIRPIKEEDADSFNELRRMPGVFENCLGIPSEKIKKNKEFISNLSRNDHSFVAIIKDENKNEKVIGTASLHVEENPRKNHCGSIGIMIHKDYQGKGVGVKLIKTLIDIADNWLMLIRVELGVFVDNEKAIALYKKFGFKEEGIKKKSAIRNGEYVDEIIMGRVK